MEKEVQRPEVAVGLQRWWPWRKIAGAGAAVITGAGKIMSHHRGRDYTCANITVEKIPAVGGGGSVTMEKRESRVRRLGWRWQTIFK